MMVAYERCDLSERRVLGNHVSTDVRVPPHDLPLFFRQRTRFVEDIVANSDLSQVMERPGCSDELTFTVTELELFTQSACELRNTDRVRLGVPVASVKGLSGEI
jgi:hypothetical protein